MEEDKPLYERATAFNNMQEALIGKLYREVVISGGVYRLSSIFQRASSNQRAAYRLGKIRLGNDVREKHVEAYNLTNDKKDEISLIRL